MAASAKGASAAIAAAPISLEVEEGENLAQMAYRVLEEMIVTLQFSPGSKISEKSLHKVLGIGRTPLREALQKLAYEGTVSIVPRAGVIISPIDIADQLSLIEVRRGLERILAARAARLAPAEVCAQFLRLALSFEQAAREDDGKLFIATDRQFNSLTVDTAQSTYAAYAITPIEAQTRRFWYLYFNRFGDLPRVCTLHAAVARAIAANDEKGAGEASDRLLDYVEEYTRRTLQTLT